MLHKSFGYVRNNAVINRHLLWTKWFLEITNQIDPRFRRDIRSMVGPIEKSITAAYGSLHGVKYRVMVAGGRSGIEYATDKGRTLFSIFRSFFWEDAREELRSLHDSTDPEDAGKLRALATLLSEPPRVGFVVLLSLLPFEKLPSFEKLLQNTNEALFPIFERSYEH